MLYDAYIYTHDSSMVPDLKCSIELQDFFKDVR